MNIYWDMKGENLVGLATSASIVIAQELDTHELIILAEFLGLLRHNLDIIRHRRFAEAKDVARS